jgi:hypothetical protein
MKINTKYNIGDIVYLVINPEVDKLMITSIVITPVGIYYVASKGTEVYDVYEIELSLEKTVI